MGHLSAKNEYQKLQRQLNRLPVGAPGEGTIFEILGILFSPEEAELVSRMPIRLATLKDIARKVGQDPDVVKARLETLADKGLVFDLPLRGQTRYIANPTVVGFFEFSMMRIRDDFDQKKLAELFHRYIVEEPEFAGQFKDGKTITPFRTLVHESALPEDYSEILDWERATELVAGARRWGRSICHCRHVAQHQERACQKTPLDVCMVLGGAVSYLARHDFAKEIDKAEALDLLALAREAGTVHICDNVQKKPTFLCNCCGCCCEVLLGFKQWHQPEAQAFSSNFLATIDANLCNGCKKCQKACPVEAIQVEKQPPGQVRGRKVAGLAVVEEETCLGCGVCVRQCKQKAMTMRARPQRRITPVNMVTRILLMSLEQGKLQDLLFDRTQGMGGLAANTLLSAFFKLPLAKQLLANDLIKSRFLRFVMEKGSKSRSART